MEEKDFSAIFCYCYEFVSFGHSIINKKRKVGGRVERYAYNSWGIFFYISDVFPQFSEIHFLKLE